MKKVTIAFDIDGTLRANSLPEHRDMVVPNVRIVNLLMALSTFKNVEIHLWSNRGAEYCQTIARTLELPIKMSHCHLKMWQKLQVEAMQNNESFFKPDIAIDDQQRFDGAFANLIVREK